MYHNIVSRTPSGGALIKRRAVYAGVHTIIINAFRFYHFGFLFCFFFLYISCLCTGTNSERCCGRVTVLTDPCVFAGDSITSAVSSTEWTMRARVHIVLYIYTFNTLCYFVEMATRRQRAYERKTHVFHARARNTRCIILRCCNFRKSVEDARVVKTEILQRYNISRFSWTECEIVEVRCESTRWIIYECFFFII